MSDQRDAGEPQAGARPAPMTLAEAQRAVDASILALGGYWPPLANLARLFEECGELARVVNQAHGLKVIKSGETRRELSEEFGDVLFVTLGLAQSLGVEAEEALRNALDKAARRVDPSAAAPPVEPTPAETDL
jgi:NTP pyrophosphatase (non-canonical NTP hydrolase)